MARHITSRRKTMLKNVKIKGYKGIEDELELPDLTDVNLILGQNNSGRSSVLEAIYLLQEPSSLKQWLNLSQKRNSYDAVDIEAIEWLFNKTKKVEENEEHSDIMFLESYSEFKISENTRFKNVTTSFKNRRILVEEKGTLSSIEEEETLSSITLLSIPEYYDKLNKGCMFDLITFNLDDCSDNINYVTTTLNSFYSKVKKVIVRNGVYIDYKGLGVAPLHTFGDEFVKILELIVFVASANSANYLHLIVDDLEVFLSSTEMIKKVVSWLINTCATNNTQLFLSTSSLEVVDSVLDIESVDVATYVLANKRLISRLYKDLARRIRYDRGFDIR